MSDDKPLSEASRRLNRDRNRQARRAGLSSAVPAMPGTYREIREWIRQVTDLRMQDDITESELVSCRRSVAAWCEVHRTQAVDRTSKAAERAAAAQERLAEVAAKSEYGEMAWVVYEHVRQELATGRRTPLPPKPVIPLRSPEPA